MIKLFNNQTQISSEELLNMPYSVNRANCIWPRKNFETDEAHKRHLGIFNGIIKEYSDNLSQAKNSKLFFMNFEEREAKKKELEKNGKNLIEINRVEK